MSYSFRVAAFCMTVGCHVLVPLLKSETAGSYRPSLPVSESFVRARRE